MLRIAGDKSRQETELVATHKCDSSVQVSDTLQLGGRSRRSCVVDPSCFGCLRPSDFRAARLNKFRRRTRRRKVAMSKVSDIPGSQARSVKPSTAKKLIQAAALAAVLVPLGTVAVETATINCISDGSGCTGTYTLGGGPQSNTWKFFSANEPGATLFYTLEISGTPTADFSLNVEDFITTQEALEGSGAMENFPGLTCIPTFDGVQCGLFDVSNFDGTDPDDMWDASGS